MSPHDTAIVAAAEDIAGRVLFPAAFATDAAALVPVANLDVLAGAGLYGLVGPPEAGGLGAGLATHCAVLEALAAGCLTTAFVWGQHHSAVRAVASSPNLRLREEWLAPLCAGERRAGIALAGLRPGPAQLVAEATSGGWLFDGSVPWVTGWGRIDAILAAARTADGLVVRALVDARDSNTLAATVQPLVAVNASGTVELTFARHFVPAEMVTGAEPYAPPPANDGGGRSNGSLALGVARRCCLLIGPGPLDAELVARRRQLDAATDDTMAAARAAAAEFALRAAATLVVTTGSRGLLAGDHAQRLAREAVFLLVFGTRPPIRSELLRRIGGERA